MGPNPIQFVVLKGGIRTQACTDGRSSEAKGQGSFYKPKRKASGKKKIKKKKIKPMGHFERKIVVSRTVRK